MSRFGSLSTPQALLGQGNSYTFQWTDNGHPVTQWWLYAGSSAGSNDLLNSGDLGSSTSTAVTNLPTDGSQVYVRRWYRIGGRWQHMDVQYTASN